MSNIEQQWANVDLANSLSTSPYTTQNEETGLITDKLLKLEEAKRSKLETLGANSTTKINNNQFKNYEDVTITGMEDADTLMLSDGRQVRVSDPLIRYDAAEVAHPESTWGSIKSALGFGDTKKSDYAEQTQNEHVGRILGKSPNAVTKEDVYSVGNMQQVQVLSDLMRNEGEDRWKAEVEPGAAQVDLNSGLNIGAKIKVSGTDAYGRVLADVVNPNTGENVTRLQAQDQSLNAFAPGYKTAGYAIDKDGNVIDTVDRDGRLMESIDLAQSAGVKYWGDMADTARSASRSLAGKLGVSEENVDKYLPKNPKLLGTDLTVEEARTNQEKVDESVGFSTRDAWQAEKKNFQDNVGEGKYATAAWNVVTNLDRFLAESAPEMVALMVPYAGMPAVLATRLNNQMEAFEETNGRKMTTEEAFTTAATILPSLVAEKLIVKSGVGSALGTGNTLAGRATGVALSTGGEALQEGYEATQEQWATGDADKRSSLDALGEYATSDETIGGIIAGGVMGGTLRGTGEVLGAMKDTGVEAIGEKISNIRSSKVGEEDRKESTTKFGSTLDSFEASVAEGRAGLNTKEFKKFFEDNKNELSVDEAKRVQSIFNTYKSNVSAVRNSLINEEGVVNKDVLRAEPVAVEELLKLVMNKDLSDEEAEGFIGQLTKEDFAEYEDIDVSRMQDKIRRIRNKSKEADSELSAFEAVNKDIFENGYLQYDSIAEALNSGNIAQKENFLQYEKAKADKLEAAIETTKNNLESIHSGDTETIKALAYLEGVNTSKDSAVNPEFEKEMIVAAAKLLGIPTENRTYVDIGKEARARYKGSNWEKAVKKATTTIEGFSNEFQSVTEGRFEVNAWEALGELVEANFANAGKMRTPGYRKVAKALGSEIGLINKFINLDKEAEFTRDELVNMLKSSRTSSKESVGEDGAAEVTSVETKQTQQEQELRRLLDVYSGEESKGQGGGYVVNVTNKDGYLVSGMDEDIFAGDIVKGFAQADIKKLLPKLKGTTKTALRAVDLYFNEQNRQKAVVDKVRYLFNLLEEVKQDRTVADYLGIEFTGDDAVFLPSMLKETPANKDDTAEEKVEPAKAEDITLEEEVEAEPFPGTPKQARELEKEKGKELAKEVKELRDDKKWLDASYRVLKELFTEANNIKNTYQPLLNAKFEEKKRVKDTLNEVINEIRAVKKDIEDAKSVQKGLNGKIKGKIADALKSVLDTLKTLLESIWILNNAKRDLYKRLDEINAEIEQLLAVKEAKANALEEVEKTISKQKESIGIQEGEIADRKAKIKDLVKEKNRAKNAFKPSTKSVADLMLTTEDSFSGWNKPINTSTADGTLETKYALTDILELSNAVAPLAVVRYSNLTEDNYTYPGIISDVNKLVSQLAIDADGYVVGGPLKSVAKGVYQYGNDKSKKLSTEVMAYNAPALSFMLSKNSSLEARENVAIAMEVAMNEWLMNDAISSDELTAKDVAKYYGMDEQDVSNELLRQLQKLGIPVRFMAENIGDKVLKHAGFKVTGNDVDEKIELSTRLKESLGMYVMYLAERKGQVTIQNKEFNEVATIMGKEEDATAEDVTVTTLVFKSDAKKTGKDNWDKRKEDLGVVEQYKGVSFTRPSIKNVKANIKRNKVTNAPKKLLEAKKDAMLREWHLKGIDGESAIAELFAMDRNTVMMAMGFVQPEDIEKLPFMMRGPARSKNRQIMTSVDSLFDLADTLKNGQELNSFWFDYFIGKNNRTYLDSDGVNNQSDKFHRHLIYTDGQRATVVPGERSEKVWKIGVAQAFGFDVDKMKVEESIAFADKMLANASEIEAGWKLVKETGAKSFTVAGIEIKVKEMGHLVDGIQAVRDYLEANGSEFETSLLIEADAVTSGFALKILQLIGDLDKPFGKDSDITGREWLRKVGIFVDEKGNLLGNSNIVDGYKTLGKNMTTKNIEESVRTIVENDENKRAEEIMSALGAKGVEDAVVKATEVTGMITDIIGELTNDKGEVSKTARDLFKPPFMTFMYGAGFAKINKELAASVIDSIMNKLAKYDSLSKEEKASLDKFMMEVTGKNLKGAAKFIFMTKDLKDEKSSANGQEGRSIYEVMEGYVSSSFGATVEATMRREFEDIIKINEAIMEINNAVFDVFDQQFKEKLGESELTLDNVDKITSTLVDSFPIVKGPISEGINDGIALFKTEIAKGLKDMFSPKYSNAGGYFADKEGKLTSRGVNHVIRLYKEAAAAAGVIPIHTLDGAAMAMTVMGKDVQQIFDAIVGGVDNIEGIVTDYNRNAYELSMKWDFLYEVLEMGNRVLGDPKNKIYVDNYITRKNEKKPFNLATYVESLLQFAEDNAQFKEEFKSKNGIIEHMVFSEETAYETSSMKLTPEEILGKVSPYVMAKLNKELDKPLEEMFKDCSKG